MNADSVSQYAIPIGGSVFIFLPEKEVNLFGLGLALSLNG